jgi:GT2 family glycosyltransferase
MTGPPRLTVVIPTYQRRDSVLRLLASLDAQAYPTGAFDVVVAVDGSSDGTAEAVQAFTGSYPVSALEGANRGRASACNAAVRAATGEIVILLDDDMEASPGFLAAHARAHDGPATRAVVGAAPIVTAPESPPFVQYMAEGFQSRMERLGQPGYRLRFRDTYTGNFSVRRNVLLSIGGFDESFRVYGHEDYELALRLQAAGVELTYNADALAYQHYEKTFASFARDGIARGRTAVLLAAKHPAVVESIKLSEYDQGPRKWRVLRALLLRSNLVSRRIPQWVVAAVEAAERHKLPRLDKWYRYAIDYFYWHGVREAGRARSADPEPGSLAARPTT